jgi:phage protein U
MLDDFEFELCDIESIQKKIEYSYAKHERIGNFPAKFAVGKWNEEFSFTAVFFLKSQALMDSFERMASDKKPVWLIFPTGNAYQTLIKNIEITKSFFDDIGSPIKQEIALSLEVYYDEEDS